MIVSELIEKLNDLKKKHGDIKVFVYWPTTFSSIESFSNVSYDEKKDCVLFEFEY